MISSRSLLWVAVCLAVANGNAVATGQQVDMARLEAGLRESEAKLQNVKIEAKYSSDTWVPSSKEWKPANKAEVTAWFLGMPGSKCRVDFHNDISPWVDGPSSFTEDEYAVAYNGRAGQTLTKRVGAPNNPVLALRGEIDAQRPPTINSYAGFVSGWQFSLYGVGDAYGQRLSQTFGKLAETVRLSADKVKYSGQECICLMIAGPITRKWYIDPMRGYSLLGYEYSGEDGEVMERVNVEKLLEALPGVFYPGRATRESFSPSGEPLLRAVYEATQVVANGPDFKESIFTINWPLGTIIHDRIADVVFEIGLPNSGDLDKVVELQVSQARNRLTTAPATAAPVAPTTTPSVRGGAPASVGDVQSHEAGHSLLKWIGLAVILAVVAIVIWRLARRKCVPAIVLVGVLLAIGECACAAALDGAAVVLEDIGNQRVYNCGLYTCGWVLRYYGSSGASKDLASELGVGSYWEKPCTMEQLQQALESRKLRVTAFKDASLQEMVGQLSRRNLCIMHTIRTGSGTGHYYVLAGSSEWGVLLVDPGKSVGWVPLDRFYARFAEKTSRVCLFIEPEGAATEKDPVVLENGKIVTIDLGRLTSRQGEFTAKIAVKNVSDSPLVIVRAQGSCGCVKDVGFGEEMTKQIAVNGTAVLQITFDAAKFGFGPFRQQVVIEATNPKKQTMMVVVQGEINVVLRGPQLAWFPERIEMGRLKVGQGIATRQRITLLVPEGVRIAPTDNDPGIVVKTLKSETVAQGQLKCVYEVELVPRVVGGFVGAITFNTSDKTTPKIVIPLRAEFLE